MILHGNNLEYKAPSTWTWQQFIDDEEYNVSGWFAYNGYIYEDDPSIQGAQKIPRLQSKFVGRRGYNA